MTAKMEDCSVHPHVCLEPEHFFHSHSDVTATNLNLQSTDESLSRESVVTGEAPDWTPIPLVVAKLYMKYFTWILLVQRAEPLGSEPISQGFCCWSLSNHRIIHFSLSLCSASRGCFLNRFISKPRPQRPRPKLDSGSLHGRKEPLIDSSGNNERTIRALNLNLTYHDSAVWIRLSHHFILCFHQQIHLRRPSVSRALCEDHAIRRRRLHLHPPTPRFSDTFMYSWADVHLFCFVGVEVADIQGGRGCTLHELQINYIQNSDALCHSHPSPSLFTGHFRI